MPRVKAIRSFIWTGGREVDIGEVFDVSDREAWLLVQGYKHCTVDEGETAPDTPVGMTVADPLVKRRR